MVSVVAVAVIAFVGLILSGLLDIDDSGPTHLDEVTGGLVPQPDRGQVESGNPETIKTSKFDANVYKSEDAVEVSSQATDVYIWGMVEDSEGRPVAEARVEIVRDVSVIVSRPQEDDTTLAVMVTGGNGTFRFRNVEPGDLYVLRVFHPRFAAARVHPIDPAKHETTQNVVVKLKKGVSIHGTVMDRSGVPIKGAKVYVYDLMIQALDPEAGARSSVVTSPKP